MDTMDVIAAWLEPAVKAWFREQSRDCAIHFHLYYKRGDTRGHGLVVIATEAPSDLFELATPERVSPAWTKRAVFDWAMDLCYRLPVLCTAPSASVAVDEEA